MGVHVDVEGAVGVGRVDVRPYEAVSAFLFTAAPIPSPPPFRLLVDIDFGRCGDHPWSGSCRPGSWNVTPQQRCAETLIRANSELAYISAAVARRTFDAVDHDGRAIKCVATHRAHSQPLSQADGSLVVRGDDGDEPWGL